MRYRLARTITNTHFLGVTQISFSPDGTLFASSDLGGKVCFWDTGSGKLLHDYDSGTSILSITWASSSSLICGLGDGTMVSLHLGKVSDRHRVCDITARATYWVIIE